MMSEDDNTAQKTEPEPEPTLEQRGDGQNEDLDPEEQGEAVIGGGARAPQVGYGRHS
jgi:hypothetical protein